MHLCFSDRSAKSAEKFIKRIKSVAPPPPNGRECLELRAARLVRPSLSQGGLGLVRDFKHDRLDMLATPNAASSMNKFIQK